MIFDQVKIKCSTKLRSITSFMTLEINTVEMFLNKLGLHCKMKVQNLEKLKMKTFVNILSL